MNDEVAVKESKPVGGINIVMSAKPKPRGRGVVRRKDGTVRYDKPELEGTYDEDKST